MSYPFIIWAMQRTGGTALADLLMAMSEYKPAEHEPFNRDRQFGAVTVTWGENRDSAALERALAAIFSSGYLIKHTYELRGKALDFAIMRAASEAGYRHLLLTRRDEFSRLVSKFVAEANGTWFKEYAAKVYDKIRAGEKALQPIPTNNILTAYRHCRKITAEIRRALAELGPDFLEVTYEDLYTGELEPRRTNLTKIFDFLDFPSETREAHQAKIREKVLGEGQQTHSILKFIPNLREVVGALSAAGCEPPEDLLEDFEPPDVPLPAARERPTQHDRTLPAGQNLPLVHEFQRLAEKYAAQGPFLEIGRIGGGPPILNGACFAGTERHGIDLDESQDLDGIVNHRGGLMEVSDKFKDGYFATIFSNAALEHDSEFWSTLREMKRLLAPRGFLMIAVPGFREPNKRRDVKVVGGGGHTLQRAVPTLRIQGPTDYWRFSPRALREVILKDYDVEEVRPLGVPSWLIGVGSKPAS